MPSTHPHIPRLAFIFDFDKTLATTSWEAMCAELGLAKEDWEQDFMAVLGDDWDLTQKKARALMDASRHLEIPLTRDFFEAASQRISLFPGVLEMPGSVRQEVEKISEDITCEFAVLSAGFGEVLWHTEIAKAFDTLYAGAFHFEGGRVIGVKRTITHAEKALYLRAYAEGLSVATSNAPGTSKSKVAEHDMHVPFDQMVYVGDGASDLQAFGYLGSVGGLTIGIEDGAEFDAKDEQSASQRVDTLAPADYRPGSTLLQALTHAARAGASRIALRS